MKQSIRNLKCILSGILISVIMTGNVFAAETVKTDTENDTKVITYDEAIALATKANSNLKEISDTLKYIDDTKSLMFMGSNYPVPPDSETAYLVTAARFQQLTAVNSLDTQQKNLRVSEELTKLSIEAGVKGEMTTITTLEQNYELAKESLELAKQQLSQKSTMYRMGM